jgi:hypothetical protein
MAFPSQRQEAFFTAHMAAFDFFGGVLRIPAKAITDSGPCRSGIPGMAIMEKDDNAEIEIIPLSNLDGQGCGHINREQKG